MKHIGIHARQIIHNEEFVGEIERVEQFIKRELTSEIIEEVVKNGTMTVKKTQLVDSDATQYDVELIVIKRVDFDKLMKVLDKVKYQKVVLEDGEVLQLIDFL